jgi:hypothetical protein
MGFANFSSYFVWFVLFFRVGFLRCRMGACVHFKARLFAPFVEALGFLQAHFFLGLDLLRLHIAQTLVELLAGKILEEAHKWEKSLPRLPPTPTI